MISIRPERAVYSELNQVTIITNEEKFGAWIEGNPIIILMIAALLTVASVHYAQQIPMEEKTENYVDEDTRIYQEFDHLFMEKFGTDMIVVLVEGDDVTSPEVLEAMDRLTDHMDDVKYVLSTQSIAKIVVETEAQDTGVHKVPDRRRIDEILDDTNPEILSGILPDERHTIIAIEMPMYISTENMEELLSETESAVEMADFPPGTNVIVTGNIALGIKITELISKSMGQLLVISAVLMVIALLLIFRHVKLPLLPLPIVLIGIIWTFGMMGFLHVPMTMVSMAAFPILIGLGIDYAIQFQNRIEEEFQRGESIAAAVVDTVAHTAPAVLIALIITSAGFVSLFTSSVPMIRDFGLLCLIGIIMCYLSALFVGVTVLYQLERRRFNERRNEVKIHKTHTIGRFLERCAEFSVSKWRAVLAAALILSVFGVYADSKVPIETDFKEFIPQDLTPLVQFHHFHNIFGGTDKINIIIQADDVTDPETMKWIDDLGTYLVGSREQVYGATSIVTYVKMYNGGEIPDEKTKIEATLDAMPDSVRDRYIDGHDTIVLDLNIGEATRDLGPIGIERLVQEIDKDIAWFEPPPYVSATQTGDLVVMTTVIDALTTGRMKMTLFGLVLIFFILLLIYRDLIKAILPTLPMIVVIGWMGGVMYISGMKYTPLTATLGALILGVGSEYAILTMERFYEEKKKTEDTMEALRIAVSSIGAAIVASGLTTVFGFSALMASPFSITSNFGAVTVLSVILSLIATFTVFSVLMIQLENWRDQRNAA
ncbi:MAG: hydrophobe/amphiphile efflux-3 (HAE3) family transporter [Methanotrichaceae archaeon]